MILSVNIDIAYKRLLQNLFFIGKFDKINAI